MTELIAFVVGLIAGLLGAGPAKAWALSKLKTDPQPVMGGPIQPDGEGWAFNIGDEVQVIATGGTGDVTSRTVINGVRSYQVHNVPGWYAEHELSAV